MTISSPPAPSGLAWQLARLTAPITRTMAGRRFFPLWAVVHHRGRVSGKQLEVPVAVIATPDRFIIVLPWGAGTNWVRNVLAAGSCVVTWKGTDHPVAIPEVLDRTAARVYYTRATWAVSQRVFQADSFLLLHRVN